MEKNQPKKAMTTEDELKEAKIKGLIAKATSPRDKVFYEGLLKKAMQRGLGGSPHERLHQEAIASRPKQIVEVVESTQSESKSQSGAVREKKKKTSDSNRIADNSQSMKHQRKSAKIIEDNALASELNLLIKQLLEAQSQLPESHSQSKLESQSKNSKESNGMKDQRPTVKFQAIGVIKGLVVYSEKGASNGWGRVARETNYQTVD